MPDITQTSQVRSTVRLDGWDSIAHHLGVHKRTARAWHKDRGLPVHQLFGKGGRVYAIGAELDQWRTQNDARLGIAGAPERADSIVPEVRSHRIWRHLAIPVIALAATAILVMLILRVRSQMQVPANPMPGRLLARSTAEGGRTQFIPVGDGPCNAVLTPDGALLFVANCRAGTASVIATASGKVIREISVGPQPEALALDRTGKRLYVGNFWGGIRVFDVDSGKPAGQIPLEGPISDIAVAPDNTLYVARREQGLAVVSPADHRATRISVTAMPMYLALSSDASRLYISYQGKVSGGRARCHRCLRHRTPGIRCAYLRAATCWGPDGGLPLRASAGGRSGCLLRGAVPRFPGGVPGSSGLGVQPDPDGRCPRDCHAGISG